MASTTDSSTRSQGSTTPIWKVWHEVSGGHDAPVRRIFITTRKCPTGWYVHNHDREDAIEWGLIVAGQYARDGESVQVNIQKENTK